jgi:hypothetical protein
MYVYVIYMCLYGHKHQFIMMFPSFIQYHVVHFRNRPLLICKPDFIIDCSIIYLFISNIQLIQNYQSIPLLERTYIFMNNFKLQWLHSHLFFNPAIYSFPKFLMSTLTCTDPSLMLCQIVSSIQWKDA